MLTNKAPSTAEPNEATRNPGTNAAAKPKAAPLITK